VIEREPAQRLGERSLGGIPVGHLHPANLAVLDDVDDAPVRQLRDRQPGDRREHLLVVVGSGECTDLRQERQARDELVAGVVLCQHPLTPRWMDGRSLRESSVELAV
jgi:hypothetical protein